MFTKSRYVLLLLFFGLFLLTSCSTTDQDQSEQSQDTVSSAIDDAANTTSSANASGDQRADIAADPTATPEATPTPAPTATPEPAPTATPAPTPTPTPTPGPAPIMIEEDSIQGVDLDDPDGIVAALTELLGAPNKLSDTMYKWPAIQVAKWGDYLEWEFHGGYPARIYGSEPVTDYTDIELSGPYYIAGTEGLISTCFVNQRLCRFRDSAGRQSSNIKRCYACADYTGLGFVDTESDSLNLRHFAGINLSEEESRMLPGGNIAAQLEKESFVLLFDTEPVEKDGYTWIKIAQPSGVLGWAASDFISEMPADPPISKYQCGVEEAVTANEDGRFVICLFEDQLAFLATGATRAWQWEACAVSETQWRYTEPGFDPTTVIYEDDTIFLSNSAGHSDGNGIAIYFESNAKEALKRFPCDD